MHTKSKRLDYRTAKAIPSRRAGVIKKELKEVIDKYRNRGLEIEEVAVDGEFDSDKIRNHIAPTTLDIHAKEEHVPEIERENRTVKERARCVFHLLPYAVWPKLMLRELVSCVLYWLNRFPTTNSISQTLSPAAIVEGAGVPNLSDEKICFRSYEMVRVGTDNTMNSRSVLGIALGTLNDSGGFYFLNLRTVSRINGFKRTELPIDQ